MEEQRQPYFFDEETSIEVVTARNRNAPDKRLQVVMDVIIRKLHEAVKEIEPSQAEWLSAVLFLTRTGQISNEWRQEFILLSDVLGVSMLIDAINNRKPTGASESTVLGPFYVEGAPELPVGANISLDHKGAPMFVHGHILDAAGRPVDGARIDVWQANDDGFYDVQQRGIQPDYNLRGVFRTAADGLYSFRSAKPKYYPIPDDGPVGQLLKGLGRDPYRPAHLHYMIQATGFQPLVTHIFDPTDPHIASDAVFGVKESLLADFKRVHDPAKAKAHGFTGDFWEVERDFVLARDEMVARDGRKDLQDRR